MSVDEKTVIIRARQITRDYPGRPGLFGKAAPIRVLKGIDLVLRRGETLAVVGESGCGKSTLARILTLIAPASGGELEITGERVDISLRQPSRELRRKVRIVFQNPYGSLNPRQNVRDILGEELILNTALDKAKREDRILGMLSRVGLSPEHADRYPHMFSGGQRQRIAIAKALMVHPEILILDEPVSALDLSVQAQVLRLLAELQREFGLSYVFISHDLNVVRSIADEVMVMHAGEVVESGPIDSVFDAPRHAYTRQLLSATPSTSIDAIRERVAARAARRSQGQTTL